MYFLVMELLEGVQLTPAAWKTLNESQREKIHVSLSEQLQLLRSVPSEGYYGRVNHQPYWPLMSLIHASDVNRPHGPYKAYEDLLTDMYTAFELGNAFRVSEGPVEPLADEWRPEQVPLMEAFKPAFRACGGREPKLTHVDPSMQNMIVRPLDGSTLQDATDYEVTFIDWADLGWYPAWAQLAQIQSGIQGRFFDSVTWNDHTELEEQFVARVAQDMESSYVQLLELLPKLYETCDWEFY